jgi:hypothetical protein
MSNPNTNVEADAGNDEELDTLVEDLDAPAETQENVRGGASITNLMSATEA